MFDRAAVEARLAVSAEAYAAALGDIAATLAALDAATARVRVLEAQVRADHFVRSDGYCLCGNVVPCAVLQRLALAPANRGGHDADGRE